MEKNYVNNIIIYHMYMYLSLCVTKHVCICLFCKMYSIKHQIQISPVIFGSHVISWLHCSGSSTLVNYVSCMCQYKYLRTPQNLIWCWCIINIFESRTSYFCKKTLKTAFWKRLFFFFFLIWKRHCFGFICIYKLF